jgi:hypothetical protein
MPASGRAEHRAGLGRDAAGAGVRGEAAGVGIGPVVSQERQVRGVVAGGVARVSAPTATGEAIRRSRATVSGSNLS